MLKNLYYKTKYFFLTYLILILSSCSEPDYRLVDGSSGKLDDFLGRWLIVNYWADWCPPCIKEMPDLMIAEKKLKDSDVSLFLVSDEDVSVISKFVDNNPYTLNFLKSNVSNEMLGVYSLPTTILFDNRGNKVETIVGVLDFSDENLINKFLKY